MWLILVLALIVLIIILTVALAPPSQNTSEPDSDDQDQTSNDFPFPVLLINLDRKPERLQYMNSQLRKMDMKYHKIVGVDGFQDKKDKIIDYGITERFYESGKGHAGCAASHIKAWQYMIDNNMDWTLILEDDAHFHPSFKKLFAGYWSSVPKEANIVYLGHTGEIIKANARQAIQTGTAACLHAYMLNKQGAQYLLDNVRPIDKPIDLAMMDLFKNKDVSYLFNGNVRVANIRPHDYKRQQGNKCLFDGIVYQNRGELGSTLYKLETHFDNN